MEKKKRGENDDWKYDIPEPAESCILTNRVKAIGACNFLPCWIANLILKRCDRRMLGSNNGTIKLLLVCLSLFVVSLNLRRQMSAVLVEDQGLVYPARYSGLKVNTA